MVRCKICQQSMYCCEICKNKEFNSLRGLSSHIRQEHPDMPISDYYLNFMDPGAGKCEVCGQITAFISLSNGFRRFCSRTCQGKSDSVKQTRAETNIKTYGTEVVSKSEAVKRKMENTNVLKYGSKCSLNNEEVKAKSVKTNIQRYGSKTFFGSEAGQKAVKEGNIRKYGVSSPLQNADILDKLQRTCQERYGSNYSLGNIAVQEKAKVSNLKKFGVTSPLANKDIRAKIAKTNQDRYGGEFSLNSPVISERIKQTNLQRYKSVSPLGNKDIQKKIRDTNISKYGTEFPIQNKDVQLKVIQTNLKRYGVEYTSQNLEVARKIKLSLHTKESQQKRSRRYKFEGIGFDSSWELAFYIFYKDHGHKIEPHPVDKFIYYKFAGKEHTYFPDFKLDGKYIEIKGPHLIDSNGLLTNPFDHSVDSLYAAKMQCMIENDVEIITDCSEFISYVNDKYGKDYLQSFRNK